MMRIGSRPPTPPDAIVSFKLTSKAHDGSPKMVISGYRPTYKIRPDYLTSTHHEFLDCENVSTGQTACAEVWFLSPQAYPKSLWVGREVDVTEASCLIGMARILEIRNGILVGSEEYLRGTWEENVSRVEREQ
jgi:hypothetical protein